MREDVGEVGVMRTGLDLAGSERMKDRRHDVETETHGHKGGTDVGLCRWFGYVHDLALDLFLRLNICGIF
jgi:hypothetical protein